MTVPHLVQSGAREYLATGRGDSLHTFETRVEDAIGHVVAGAKIDLINEIVDELERSDSSGERLQALLDFLDRQRHVVEGKL